MKRNMGVVRRIDELGRIVIPREIRKKIGIVEGDAMDFWMNNKNELILTKYNPERNLIIETLQETLDFLNKIENAPINIIKNIEEILENE